MLIQHSVEIGHQNRISSINQHPTEELKVFCQYDIHREMQTEDKILEVEDHALMKLWSERNCGRFQCHSSEQKGHK